MEVVTAKIIDIMRQYYNKRSRINSRYSLRAFARDLKMNPGTLSSVLSGKRALPEKKLKFISDVLNLSPKDKVWFETSKKQTIPSQTQVILDHEKYAQIISDWEYFAVLNLLKVKDFQPDNQWIAKRLGLQKVRVNEVVDTLFEIKYLTIDQYGNWKRREQKFSTSEDIKSAALVKAHEDELKIALIKLFEIPLEERDYSSLVFAADKNKIPLMKEAIRKFRKEFNYTFSEDASADEVYNFSLQLFPLTKKMETP